MEEKIYSHEMTINVSAGVRILHEALRPIVCIVEHRIHPYVDCYLKKS